MCEYTTQQHIERYEEVIKSVCLCVCMLVDIQNHWKVIYSRGKQDKEICVKGSKGRLYNNITSMKVPFHEMKGDRDGMGSYSQRHELRFEPMEAHERKMIHLLAQCYGCESESYGIRSERYTTIYTTR